jgi:flagellar biosynthetic protein FliR
MQVILDYLPNFLLIFCRITGFFVTAPVFSTRGVPAAFKIGISLFVTLIAFSSVGLGEAAAFDWEYALSIVKESLLGMLLGFTAYLFFTAAQIAGSFVDMQMGFGIANVIDPMTGVQSPILGNLKFFVAMLLFLSMNGHHYLLSAIMDSYAWIPLDNAWLKNIASGSVSTFLFESFVQVFKMAFQLAAPLVVAMFLADLGLGMLARTAPQFNIFVIGIPLKIIIGFLLLLVMIPGFLALFQALFAELFEAMYRLMSGMA